MTKGILTKRNGLLLCVIVLIISSLLYMWYVKWNDPIEAIPGIHYGDVYGDFEPSGKISSKEVYEDEKFWLWIYDSEDNVTSSFYLKVWNVSEVTLGDISHGHYFYNNYTLNNEPIIIEDPGGYLVCQVMYGTSNIEYADLSMENDEGRYEYHYHFSSVFVSAVLDHQTGPYLDFQLLDVNVRIGNETIYLKEGKFGFPEDEHANIELVAKGHGRISPMPTFIVNGTVTITDFREKTADGRDVEDHDRFIVTSSNITIITREKPVNDVTRDGRYVILQPWSIEVQVPEEIPMNTGR